MTIVGILKMAHVAEDAARSLSHEHGVEAEVIDPRTLRPLDLDTILDSVRKTNRAVIVEEGWPHGGVGANLATLITEQAFDYLDAPVQRVTGADVHMPYSRRLEQAAIPHTEHVVSAALATLEALDLGMADVVMPRLSDSMEEGTVLQWLKQVGDEVAIGDELVEIETDKANMAYESDLAGTLTEILVPEGDTVAIGTPIARVGDSDEGSAAGSAGPVAEDDSSSSRDEAAGEEPPSAPPAEQAKAATPEAPAAASRWRATESVASRQTPGEGAWR